ncbi:S-adenosyl methyltransferase [Haloactinospora alba]|uniref:S-adenosyl methyltransferase n=1 Tax=Haloactinospora alba TaxID=405555 RepID=A0A543NHS5_9ACTN|nr:SAM-dependent methyltransferase [Haloactinospora alba]TQN31314.1 S-adenosyl methyltransferase [Haloactinospora alba]
MTDERRALHTDPERPAAEIPSPRVIDMETHRPRPGAGAEPVGNAEEKRGFLRRVVAYLAADAGVRQFIDMGSRLPVREVVQQVADAHVATARIVYVDPEGTVPLRGRAHARGEAVSVVAAGSGPHELAERLQQRGLVDFRLPAAALLVDSGCFPESVMRGGDLVPALYEVMPSGSYLAMAREPDSADTARTTLTAAVFSPFTLLAPGVADLAWWPYPDHEVASAGTGIPAGVGRKE